MKDIIFQLEMIKANCIGHDMTFDAGVLDGCIGMLKAMDDVDAAKTKTIKDLRVRINNLEDKLSHTERERDAAIADITELARFYKRRSICDFCKHDRDSIEECRSYLNDNKFINNCFEWRGYNRKFNEVII